MRNRELIFVSNALANGGAARVLSLLANQLAMSGRRVGVLAYSAYDDEYVLDSQVEKEYGPSGSENAIRAQRIRWIREVVRANPKATIVAFECFVNLQALIACWGLPNRVIVSERNDPARVGSGFPRDNIRKALYRRADMLVCQTDDAAAYFPTNIATRVILNPLKPGLPEPFTGERQPTVVTFCRLEEQKNLEMLIGAFAIFHKRHPEYSLEIYGNGSRRAILERFIDECSLTQCAHIYPARSDIHDVIRKYAMFVLPSDYEGLSNSMLEAMALGIPTICTDCPCGGARMVIDNGQNGLLVPVGGIDELVAAMRLVAENEAYARRFAQRATQVRDNLTIEAVTRDWAQVIFGG